MAATLDTSPSAIIRRIKPMRTRMVFRPRPRWPMIVMRTPKGWTVPEEIDGRRTEGYWRSHQVPMGEMHENPAHVRILEQWMKSYQPAELFDDTGRLRRTGRACPARHPPDECESPRQWRRAAPRSAPSRLRRLRYRNHLARLRRSRINPCPGRFFSRRDEAQRRPQELPRLRARRDGFESAWRCIQSDPKNMGCRVPQIR